MKRVIDRLSNDEFIDICKSITGTRNNIHLDLHSKVCLLFHEKNKGAELNDDELKRLFSSYAFNEYRKSNSSFNFERKGLGIKNRRRNKVHVIRCDKEDLERITDLSTESSDQYKELYEKVHQYLEIPAEDEQIQFINGIGRMYFEGWSIYKIIKETGISKVVIENSIKQFIKDVKNYYSIDNHCFSAID